MNLQQRIAAFARLGDYIRTLPAENFRELAEKAALENPWFTPDNVQRALRGLLQYLDFDKLSQWTDNYRFDKLTPQTIAIIMAGNIPLVGFHDLLCVLISGHRALVKYSSKDSALLKHVVNKLIEIETAFSSRIILTNETLNAPGDSNSMSIPNDEASTFSKNQFSSVTSNTRSRRGAFNSTEATLSASSASLLSSRAPSVPVVPICHFRNSGNGLY